ncbi:hypothetical protein BOTBODRAFT_176916 [Botryobasidium botryosum FD-172 SS1]|uniref:Uncharacterized protein n=1 Tax=Botryobasidium botryosum (strain FD-172 SS1) TaxID=930990 RepID=A0A067M828_BOTB1|nr:hypothetical protein BOTBODRAFT_176916 [Botryobasidium botryosum FD-172 SS1]
MADATSVNYAPSVTRRHAPTTIQFKQELVQLSMIDLQYSYEDEGTKMIWASSQSEPTSPIISSVTTSSPPSSVSDSCKTSRQSSCEENPQAAILVTRAATRNLANHHNISNAESSSPLQCRSPSVCHSPFSRLEGVR